MARVHLPLDQIRPTSSGEYAERAVLTALSEGLDARFHLFHSTHWAVAEGAADRKGERDVVVIDAVEVAVLKIKSAVLDPVSTSLLQGLGEDCKDLSSQAPRQLGEMESEIDAPAVLVLERDSVMCGPNACVSFKPTQGAPHATV